MSCCISGTRFAYNLRETFDVARLQAVNALVKHTFRASPAPNWCHKLLLQHFGAGRIAKNKHYRFNMFTIRYF
ncbi:hypothetical protein DAQ1742_03036 [Dickeya aquatica]|uniref:Uncharacterized protein n=1 Tax=Dickeya aquatica TaxID=1401087 RepID=A0A375ACN6_9GAMM|nr:hypothetical protein DAQ1742_03036 [Dickeya aquatica]